MTHHLSDASALAIAALLGSLLTLPARGQTAPARESNAAEVSSQEAARRTILESDRWQQTQRALNEWLAVQRIYTPAEIATLRAEFRTRIASMSPRELENFMKDIEERLVVLTSPEAADARQWISQFLSTARNAEQRLKEKRPDVAHMTASEIRQELEQFHRERESRRQAQAAFDRQRALQVQSAQSWQTRTRQGRQEATQQSSRAATHAPPSSRYAPQRVLQPAPFHTPTYTVGPWGAPIRWHPLGGYW